MKHALIVNGGIIVFYTETKFLCVVNLLIIIFNIYLNQVLWDPTYVDESWINAPIYIL